MLLGSAARLHVCHRCRLHSLISVKQSARSRKQLPKLQTRHVRSKRFSTTSRLRQQLSGQTEDLRQLLHELDTSAVNGGFGQAAQARVSTRSTDGEESAEAIVARARRTYGDALPEGHLSAEEQKVYERLYGKPRALSDELDVTEVDAVEEDAEAVQLGTGVLREGKEGTLEEVLLEDEDYLEDTEDVLLEGDAASGQDPSQDILSEDVAEQEDDSESVVRTHPLTMENRFGTLPSTIQLPKDTFVDPITFLLSGLPSTHLSDSAHRIFGGPGLPFSTATPASGRGKPPKPIPLDAYQGRMSEMDGDVYMASLMPAIFASVTGVVAESRKRLGTAWAEDLVRKAEQGNLRILDAGGGGAGALAVREIMKAEWLRMHEDDDTSPMDLAHADGKIGGAAAAPPLGHATVLTGSDVLRHRASQLLENTTFIPRLPDYIHASDEAAKRDGKFDIILAPHTLWPMKEDFIRKQHVQNLWRLLSSDGGLLVLLEKGVPRGFELVAGAREMLLDSTITSPGSDTIHTRVDEPRDIYNSDEQPVPRKRKETGMIIAPCTNHAACPMFRDKTSGKGRMDFCHFEQRYIRPPFLQRILGVKDKNHEDVKFSYLSVMRGKDLRNVTEEETEELVQGPRATDRAFAGFEDLGSTLPLRGEAEKDAMPSADTFFEDSEPAADDLELKKPHSLSLPRAVRPPLKRRGHVILDLCTPAGTLERWTVPRSFSKQAFRDARKSSWGDLWALGAKTRVVRNVKLGDNEKATGAAAKKGSRNAKNVIEVGVDPSGKVKPDDVKLVTGGRLRQGAKVKGIRDKRDKKGTGNGRAKRSPLED